MSDSSIGVLESSTPSHKVDNEAVTGHPAGTVQRQRIQIAGVGLDEIARVRANGPATDDMGVVVRPTPSAVPYSRYLNFYLTSDGAAPAADSEQADVVGTLGTPVIFWRGPPAGEKWFVNRLLVTIKDSGNVAADKYGNLAALANGIRVEIRQGASTTLLDLLEGITVKTNAHWGRESFDILHKSFGSGDEYVIIRWTFMRAGRSLLLDGDNSERFACLVQDDLSTLSDHWFKIQGFVV